MKSLFAGRLGRGAFIVSIVGTGFFSVVPLSLIQSSNKISLLLGIIIGIFNLLLILSVYIRRLHDLNKPWPWFLLLCIPIINLIALAVLIIIPGTKGKNRFGTPPEKMLF